MGRLLLSLALVWCWAVPASTSAQRGPDVRLSMSASATRVRVGEPFAVEVRADLKGVDGDEDIELPDFGPFELIGRRVSRPFSFSFGFGTGGQHAQVQSQLIYTFTLRALAPGKHTIEPATMTVNGKRFSSRSLTIEAVGDPIAPGTTGGLPPQDARPSSRDVAPPDGALDGATYDQTMFLRTVVDKRKAYVGEQVTVTLYLYVRGGLRDTPSITREPTNEGFWTHDLLPPQRSLSAVRQEVNGRVFSVYVLRRYAAFPMRPGTLTIGAASVEVGGGSSIFDLLTGPAQPVQRTGVPVSVEVTELPARKSTANPLHVGELSLEASLDPKSAKVGDAVTLQVTARGVGNLRGLKFENPSLPGIDVLAPEISDQVSTDFDQVGGTRVFKWLLLPRTAGTHQVQPFVVDVLDPKTGTYTSVRTAALSLEVTGTSVPEKDDARPVAQAPEPRDDADTSAANLSYGPLRVESELRRTRRPIHQAPWFPWAVLSAPLSVGLAFGVSSLKRLRATYAQRRAGSQDAFRTAAAQLAQAREALAQGDAQASLAAIAQALKGALEARLGEPVGGLTLSALERHLRERGIAPALVEQVIAQLDFVESSRFAPIPKSPRELEDALMRARASLDALSDGSRQGAVA